MASDSDITRHLKRGSLSTLGISPSAILSNKKLDIHMCIRKEGRTKIRLIHSKLIFAHMYVRTYVYTVSTYVRMNQYTLYTVPYFRCNLISLVHQDRPDVRDSEEPCELLWGEGLRLAGVCADIGREPVDQ